MRGTLGRLALVLALGLAGAGCGALTGGAAGPSPSSVGSAPPTMSFDPVALVGSWRVSGAGVEDGAVLRIDVTSISVWRRCGFVEGDWNADHEGLFAAALWGGDRACLGGQAFDVPWLQRATSFRLGDRGPVLLDETGSEVAQLLPGGSPTPGLNIAPEEAEPPVVDEQTRHAFPVAGPLPPDLRAPDRASLLGTWLPVDQRRAAGRAHLTFADDGTWKGSDGCNGSGGRWVLGDDGAIVSTAGGASTLIGCANVPVASWIGNAARLGLAGDVLVLLDAHGRELGRLRRA